MGPRQGCSGAELPSPTCPSAGLCARHSLSLPRNCQSRSQGRPLGWGLGFWGCPFPLTPALPQPLRPRPLTSASRKSWLMISPPGQVRDKARHIRGGRGGSAVHPASQGAGMVSPDAHEEPVQVARAPPSCALGPQEARGSQGPCECDPQPSASFPGESLSQPPLIPTLPGKPLPTLKPPAAPFPPSRAGSSSPHSG